MADKKIMDTVKKGQCRLIRITAATAQTETSVRSVPNPPDCVGVVSMGVSATEPLGTGKVVAATEEF